MRNWLFDLAVCAFGVSAWISVNGIWVELPVLVGVLPEEWALASYLSVIVQLANVGPITYSLLLWKWPNLPKQWAILSLLGIGTVATLMLALFWDVTSVIGGELHSTCLFAFTFLLALVDCTSSVLYMPFMAAFKGIYLNSYLVGEGLSGFLPSIVALAQGVGGNPECIDVTLDNGTIISQEYQEPARFSADVFFFILTGLMGISTVAFISIIALPSFKNERVVNSAKVVKVADENGNDDRSNGDSDNSDSGDTDTDSDRPIKKHTNKRKFYSYLTVIFCLCFLCNGFLPSIQTYSCLPYGNTIYHICVTLNSMANPVAAFTANFVKIRAYKFIFALTAFSLVLTGYLLATALYSPEPLGGLDVGGPITATSWVLFGFTVTLIRVSIAGYCRERSEASLFWCGAFTQLGSAFGAVLAFVLVNYTNSFQQYYVQC